MIVLGADMRKGSHTIAAVAASTGELLGDRTVQVGARGFATVLAWAWLGRRPGLSARSLLARLRCV
jgi:hypothetical protein